MQILKTFCLLLILVVLNSCNQSAEADFKLVEKEIDNKNSDYRNQLAYSNFSNPFDSIGYHHNASLSYAASQIDVVSSHDTIFKASIFDYFNFGSGVFDFSMDLELPHRSLDFQQLSIAALFDSIIAINSNFLNTEELTLMNGLESILIEVNYDGYQELIDTIIGFENNILTSSFEHARTQPLFLAMTSILRHSIFYWSEALTDSNHPYYDWVTGEFNGEATTRWIWLPPWFIADIFAYVDCYANSCPSCLTDDLMLQICPGQAAYSSARFGSSW